MGGIWRLIPTTYAMMWIGSLALAGLPFFAGFYSKDIILEAAYGAHSGVGQYAFWLGIVAALLTAFYSWRLIFLTFHGKPRANEHVMAHVHESPPVMIGPLVVLALGAVFSGWLAYEAFVGHDHKAFWGAAIFVAERHDPLEAAHHVPGWVKLLPIFVAVAGILVAWIAYILRPGLPEATAEALRPIHRFFFNKWYFDELYDRLFVRPAFYLGRGLWKTGDGALIDGVGPDGVAAATRSLSVQASRLQSGYVYHYAFAMLIGVVVLVSWYLYARI